MNKKYGSIKYSTALHHPKIITVQMLGFPIVLTLLFSRLYNVSTSSCAH